MKIFSKTLSTLLILSATATAQHFRVLAVTPVTQSGNAYHGELSADGKRLLFMDHTLHLRESDKGSVKNLSIPDSIESYAFAADGASVYLNRPPIRLERGKGLRLSRLQLS